MQLDRTGIAIRERGMMEILDLSLHVIRAFLPQLLALFLVGCVPLLILNRLALGELILIDQRDYGPDEYVMRISLYVFTMGILIMLQAPLVTAPMTTWLGIAVFSKGPRVLDALRETWSVKGRLLWCQGILRGSIPATVLALLLTQGLDDYGGTVPLLVLLGFVVGVVRSFRPFINEIVLLEKNPLTTGKSNQAITIGKRNSALHGAGSGTLFFQFLGSGLISIMLTLALFYTFLFIQGVLLNRWSVNSAMLLYALPLSFWICAFLMNVFRFLCYLDLRIRQEGWAVELRMRAEASRLQSDLLLNPNS